MRFKSPTRRAFAESSIYALSCGPYFKVGMSVSVHSRIRSLQIGNPYEIDLALEERFDACIVQKIEFQTHKILDQYRVRGEWFDCDLRTIRDAIDQAYMTVKGIPLDEAA